MEIYILGDTMLMFNTLQSVSLLFQAGGYEGVIKVALLIGMLMAVGKTLVSGNPWQSNDTGTTQLFGPWTMAAPLALAMLMFGPKADFLLADAYDMSYSQPVYDVPVFVGFPMAITTQIGKLISEEFETAFGAVNDSQRMTKTGFMSNLYTADSLRRLSLKDLPNSAAGKYDIDRSMLRYYNDCMSIELNAVYPAPKVSPKMLKESPDVMGLYGAAAYANINTVMYLATTTIAADEEETTCGIAWGKLASQLDPPTVSMDSGNSIRDIFFKKKAIAGTGEAVLQGSLDALTPTTVSASRMLSQRLVIENMQRANFIASAAAGGNSSGAAMVLAQADALKNAKFITEKSLFDKYVRPFMAFVEIFAVAISPLIPFFVLVGSFKALTGWLMMTAWISLWAPILTIINFFVMYKVKDELTAYEAILYAQGMPTTDVYTTLSGFTIFAGVTNEWLAIGAMLATTTPALAMGILTGAMSGLSSAAGALTSSTGTNMTPMVSTPLDIAPNVKANSGMTYDPATGAMTRPGYTAPSVNATQAFGSMKEAAVARSKSATQARQAEQSAAIGEGFKVAKGRTFTSGTGSSVALDRSEGSAVAQKYEEAFAKDKTFDRAHAKAFGRAAVFAAVAGTPELFGSYVRAALSADTKDEAKINEGVALAEKIAKNVGLTSEDSQKLSGKDVTDWKNDTSKQLMGHKDKAWGEKFANMQKEEQSAQQSAKLAESASQMATVADQKDVISAVAGMSSNDRQRLMAMYDGSTYGAKAHEMHGKMQAQAGNNSIIPKEAAAIMTVALAAMDDAQKGKIGQAAGDLSSIMNMQGYNIKMPDMTSLSNDKFLGDVKGDLAKPSPATNAPQQIAAIRSNLQGEGAGVGMDYGVGNQSKAPVGKPVAGGKGRQTVPATPSAGGGQGSSQAVPATPSAGSGQGSSQAVPATPSAGSGETSGPSLPNRGGVGGQLRTAYKGTDFSAPGGGLLARGEALYNAMSPEGQNKFQKAMEFENATRGDQTKAGFDKIDNHGRGHQQNIDAGNVVGGYENYVGSNTGSQDKKETGTTPDVPAKAKPKVANKAKAKAANKASSAGSTDAGSTDAETARLLKKNPAPEGRRTRIPEASWEEAKTPQEKTQQARSDQQASFKALSKALTPGVSGSSLVDKQVDKNRGNTDGLKITDQDRKEMQSGFDADVAKLPEGTGADIARAAKVGWGSGKDAVVSAGMYTANNKAEVAGAVLVGLAIYSGVGAAGIAIQGAARGAMMEGAGLILKGRASDGVKMIAEAAVKHGGAKELIATKSTEAGVRVARSMSEMMRTGKTVAAKDWKQLMPGSGPANTVESVADAAQRYLAPGIKELAKKNKKSITNVIDGAASTH